MSLHDLQADIAPMLLGIRIVLTLLCRCLVDKIDGCEMHILARSLGGTAVLVAVSVFVDDLVVVVNRVLPLHEG